MWETVLREFRHSIRILKTRPGFSTAVAFTIALGIAANTTIFSAIDLVLLRSLPYKDPDRIITIWNRYGKTKETRFRSSVSPPDYFDRVEQSKTLESVAAFTMSTFDLIGSGEPKRIQSFSVTASFFPLLGVQPLHGRFPTAADDQPGKNHVVVISYFLWSRDFGRDPEIIGRQLNLNGSSYTVIGVMPPSFRFLDPEIGMWSPIAFKPEAKANDQRGNEYLMMIGRIKNGISLQKAVTEMEVIAARVPVTVPERREFLLGGGWGAIVIPLHEFLVSDIKPALFVLMGAVFCVLLIVCANVSHLMLVRYSERRKDIAIRAALGANRWQLIRTLLFESTLLSVLGAVLGLIFARWGLHLLTLITPIDVSFFGEMQINLRVFVFVLILTFFIAFILATLPLFQFRKTDLQHFIKETSLDSSGKLARHYMLVTIEVGLSLVLFIGAVLLMKSFLYLLQENPGFDATNRITVALSTPTTRYPERIHRGQFYRELRNRIATLPEVKSVGASATLPLTGENWTATFAVQGHRATSGEVDPNFEYRIITPNWIKTMGIPLRLGRDFDDRDTSESPLVVMIDERLAARYWNGAEAIGKKIGFSDDEANVEYREIVGIVGSIKNLDLQTVSKEQIYLPHSQMPVSSMFVVVHTNRKPLEIIPAIRNQVSSLDSKLPIDRIRTMTTIVSNSVSRPRFQAWVLGTFAVLSSVLAIIGIYGVTSYSVRQQTREIGIRMALGATHKTVTIEIVRYGLKAALFGIVFGSLAAIALSKVLMAVVFRVQPTDPVVILGTAVLMLLVAFVACYVPARRAAKVNPVIALRYE
jgi:putative ABC transport system permease protein